MATKRSKRMSLIHHLAQEQEDLLLKQLGIAQQQYQEQVAQYQQLEQYRDEYYRKKTELGPSATALSNYVNFLANLESALFQQQQKVDHAEKVVGDIKMQWQHAHVKAENLEGLVERYKQDEALQTDKKEQKMLDDIHNQARHRSAAMADS